MTMLDKLSEKVSIEMTVSEWLIVSTCMNVAAESFEESEESDYAEEIDAIRNRMSKRVAEQVA